MEVSEAKRLREPGRASALRNVLAKRVGNQRTARLSGDADEPLALPRFRWPELVDEAYRERGKPVAVVPVLWLPQVYDVLRGAVATSRERMIEMQMAIRASTTEIHKRMREP